MSDGNKKIGKKSPAKVVYISKTDWTLRLRWMADSGNFLHTGFGNILPILYYHIPIDMQMRKHVCGVTFQKMRKNEREKLHYRIFAYI